MSPSATARGCLTPSTSMPMATTQQMAGEMHAVDHEGREVELERGRWPAVRRGRSRWRPRNGGTPPTWTSSLRRLDGGAHRLKAGRIAAGGQLGQHPGHGHLARAARSTLQQLDTSAAPPRLVRSALRSLGRRIETWRPPRATRPSSVPWRTAARSGSCHALRARPGPSTSLIQDQRPDDLESGADGEGQQSLLELAGELGQRPRSRRQAALSLTRAQRGVDRTRPSSAWCDPWCRRRRSRVW